MACCILVATLKHRALIPYDFFLWRHLKANVFSTFVPDLLMLKSQFQAKSSKTQEEMLQKVYENILVCFLLYIGNNGIHLPNVIIK